MKSKWLKIKVGRWYCIAYNNHSPLIILFHGPKSIVKRRIKYIDLAEERLTFYDNWEDVLFKDILYIREITK